ncbi:FliI/YscN family ATPase [bacterium]|nr:FliI/YscN family ATPase [bacterium]
MVFKAATYRRAIEGADPIRAEGQVSQVIGTVIEGSLPDCAIGQLCLIMPGGNQPPLRAEVVGFHRDRVLIMPLGEMRGLKPGSVIVSLNHAPTVSVGPELLGRVLDGLGHPIDGGVPIAAETSYPIYNEPVNAFRRERISEPLDLGVRAINGLLTCAVGQRVGIMAGSGVGKSTLLGQIARQTRADINVIALIGERGRELRDFIERDLGEEGLRRSVLVTATSDRSPLERVRSAFVATAIAEYYRDQGKRVLLMMDSLTRFAMAQREIGLSIGEPPTTKGYTPSVFSMLPRLLERAGMGDSDMGSITGLYTVLVDGDDMTEPIADATRAILDGHIVLTRSLADQGHYPAIDVLQSKSRLMTEVVSREHYQAAVRIQELIAAHRKAETLINIGAYAAGSNQTIDRAIRMHDDILKYLRQGMFESATLEESTAILNALARQAESNG